MYYNLSYLTQNFLGLPLPLLLLQLMEEGRQNYIFHPCRAIKTSGQHLLWLEVHLMEIQTLHTKLIWDSLYFTTSDKIARTSTELYCLLIESILGGCVQEIYVYYK